MLKFLSRSKLFKIDALIISCFILKTFGFEIFERFEALSRPPKCAFLSFEACLYGPFDST